MVIMVPIHTRESIDMRPDFRILVRDHAWFVRVAICVWAMGFYASIRAVLRTYVVCVFPGGKIHALGQTWELMTDGLVLSVGVWRWDLKVGCLTRACWGPCFSMSRVYCVRCVGFARGPLSRHHFAG